MSAKKLSDSDQQEIIELYRTSSETTATLAQRYRVSSSTVSRFLKSYFSPEEYDNLVQQKRLIGRKFSTEAQLELETYQEVEAVVESNPEETPEETYRKADIFEIADEQPQPYSEELTYSEGEDEDIVDVMSLNEFFGEDIETLEDDDEDYAEEEEWEDSNERPETQIITNLRQIEILPLSDAYFPKICYVVIDRFAELITRPLKDFGELGKIPVTEIEEKTLPIFDNQKVARRFSNRSQRVIKIPDGRLLKKTANYLKAKGITRLLIDGQVYAC